MSTAQVLTDSPWQQSGQSVMAQQEDYWLQRYLPLVKRCASQLRSQAGPAMDQQDMEQIGMMALLDTIRRYPGEHDDGFGSYCSKRVRGAILDELRRQDWRPRQLRQQANQLKDKQRELQRQLGRPPQDQEVAAAMGLSDSQYREQLYAAQADSFHSLEQLLEEGKDTVGGQGEPLELQRRTVRQALSCLKPREQLLLTLYYQHELNLKEIALVLNLTESRVCQLQKQAIDTLRHHLS